MAKFWCVNCQEEVEHEAFYCHSRCGNNCEERCFKCKQTTLTTTLPNASDDIIATVRQATAVAQKRAKNGEVGNIEVEVSKFDPSTGKTQSLIVAYNTYEKRAAYTKPANW